MTFQRPKLDLLCVLTDPIDPHRHVILAFISSRIPSDLLESDLLLNSSDADFTITGLRISSILRLHRLMTVTTELIRRELGELSTRMQGEIVNRLRKLFNTN